MELPQIGLGTWDLRGDACMRAVLLALDIGYRHIDTAHVYNNHQVIGKAIKGFDRNQLYITSKIALQEQVDPLHPLESVQKACELALKELETDYLDLYLIHAPNRSFPLETIFGAMETLVHQKKVLKVGVSNYTLHHLEDLEKAGFTPFANQVEFHPYLNQQKLLEYCQKQHIEIIGFRPFGKGKLLTEEPLFDRIGVKYNKSGAQVILRWLIQKKIAVIPKASSEKHLRENIAIFDFTLTEEEMNQLDNLSQNKRYCLPGNSEYDY